MESAELFSKLDLGWKTLWPEWKAMMSPRYLKDDLAAAALVASVSIPLSLSLALAGGMEPVTGLITAVIAGIACALWGGTPLAISGPSNAMPVILAAASHQFDATGIFFIGLGCGLLQLLTGIFRFGNLIRFIPFSIIAGLSAGFGMILVVNQVPHALGLNPSVPFSISEPLLSLQLPTLILASSTLAISLILPTLLPHVPAPFFALLIPTLAAYFLHLDVPRIGTLLHELPSPKFPDLPKLDFEDLLTTTLAVYVIASLETLLSSSSVQRVSKQGRTDPDQEMIGQGLSNCATAIFGGFPATGVIARTSLNIQAGAKTRRAAIFQSLIILAALWLTAPLISKIPIAVLTGITLSIALRMLHPREFFRLWKVAPKEAIIYALTFFIIVFVDLFAGIRVGILMVLLLGIVRGSQSRSQSNWNLFSSTRLGSQRFQELKIEGTLNLQSSGQIELIRSQLEKIPADQSLVVDVSKVDAIDAPGAAQLIEVLEPFLLAKRRVVLLGLKPECRKVLIAQDTHHRIAKTIASSETELMELLYERSSTGPLDRLIYGVEKFKTEMQASYGSLFKNLADGQSPHTLFITCSDSRIDPNLITSTHPGELFIVRNVGNLIPPYGEGKTPAEGAAIEFAVGVLQVKEIIVCGHSGCGAIKEVLQGNLARSGKTEQLPSLQAWLKQAQSIKDQLPENATLRQAAELNAVHQLDNLKTYPIIRDRIAAGQLRVHSWYYNIGDSELEEWDTERQYFVTIGSRESKSQTHRMEAGIQYQVPLLSDEDKD